MEDVAKLVDRIIVMHKGKAAMQGTPKEIFANVKELEQMELAAPQVSYVFAALKQKGYDVPTDIYTIEEAKQALYTLLKRGESMIRDITIGQYYPANSVIHQLDARVKIIVTFLFIVSLFVVNTLMGYVLVTVLLGAVIKISKVPLKFMLRGLKSIMIIIIFTAVINLFLTQGEQIIWQFGFLKLTKEGIYMAIKMCVRLVLLIVGSSLLTLTTTPIQLTDGIEYILKPLKKIGVPAHEIAMMMTIALRFIPTLLDETDKIIKAQQAGGADFDTRKFIAKSKKYDTHIGTIVYICISTCRRTCHGDGG